MMRDWQKMNQKQRKQLFRRVSVEDPGLDVIHPNAAGIDVGNASHFVAISPKRDSQPVREFPCFTEHLRRLLQEVEEVVMESTAQYWRPVWAAGRCVSRTGHSRCPAMRSVTQCVR